MAHGCLADFLRFVVLVLGMLCLALWLTGLWLGPEHSAVYTLTGSPTNAFEVHVSGPTPELRIAVWRQDLARQTYSRLIDLTLPTWSVGVTTIVVCLVAYVVDMSDPRQRRRP